MESENMKDLDIKEGDILAGDEFQIDGHTFKVCRFGKVENGEYHHISSKEYNELRRKAEE